MTSCADFLWMIADDKDVYIFHGQMTAGMDETVQCMWRCWLFCMKSWQKGVWKYMLPYDSACSCEHSMMVPCFQG